MPPISPASLEATGAETQNAKGHCNPPAFESQLGRLGATAYKVQRKLHSAWGWGVGEAPNQEPSSNCCYSNQLLPRAASSPPQGNLKAGDGAQTQGLGITRALEEDGSGAKGVLLDMIATGNELADGPWLCPT